ncbi:hypothetical protein NMY22_g15451 [Coprinellus aureogranulatus]|nr:hypothetical protein NMY22_g15451 [Coprinellus aureogranulatus]
MLTRFKSTLSHITLTRTTIYFLLLTLLHTFTQGVTQSLLFSLDARQHSFLQEIIARGDIPAQNTTFIDTNGKGGLFIKICSDIPISLKGRPYPCTTVFETGTDTGGSLRTLDWKRRNELEITRAIGTPGAVVLQPPSSPAIFLSHQCIQNLVQPWQRLTNYRREDIASIALQLWLLIISVFGVVHDSVPHIRMKGKEQTSNQSPDHHSAEGVGQHTHTTGPSY